MASGVATVWVTVSDMDRAVAFYGTALGFDIGNRQGDEWAEVDADGLTIGLNGRETPTAAAGGGAVITFTPDGDIEAEVSRLKDAGVEFTGGISNQSFGRIVPFKDSEGNDLQLIAPPL